MKKLLKSKKALSPVVAAIILIAVTVAVSIAVAAWMGSLTFTFMETEQIQYTKATFGGASEADNNYIEVDLVNTGTSDVVLMQARVTGYEVDYTFTPTDPIEVQKGVAGAMNITTVGWAAGKAYTIELVSSKANKFPITEIA